MCNNTGNYAMSGDVRLSELVGGVCDQEVNVSNHRVSAVISLFTRARPLALDGLRDFLALISHKKIYILQLHVQDGTWRLVHNLRTVEDSCGTEQRNVWLVSLDTGRPRTRGWCRLSGKPVSLLNQVDSVNPLHANGAYVDCREADSPRSANSEVVKEPTQILRKINQLYSKLKKAASLFIAFGTRYWIPRVVWKHHHSEGHRSLILLLLLFA